MFNFLPFFADRTHLPNDVVLFWCQSLDWIRCSMDNNILNDFLIGVIIVVVFGLEIFALTRLYDTSQTIKR